MKISTITACKGQNRFSSMWR